MGFNDTQIRALEAKLSGKHVRTRSEQGKELSYIEGWHVIAEANRVFGFDGWDRETVEASRIWQGSSGGSVQCAYTARVRITVRAGETVVTREGSGAGHGHALTAGEAHEQALKEAETDATKRALVTFGNIFGLTLYDREQKGVRQKRREQPPKTPAATGKGDFVLVLSPTDLEMFERPEAWCSAFRKFLRLIKTPDELMAFWKANEETVIRLREQYRELKTRKGVHYAEILGQLYTSRLQEFAEETRKSEEQKSYESVIAKGREIIPATPRRRDRDHLLHVASQPCLVCGRTPAHAHHLMFAQPRAMGRKVSDEYTVPLCALHHRELHDAGDEQAWWQRRKTDPMPVAQELWERTRRQFSGSGLHSSLRTNSSWFRSPHSR